MSASIVLAAALASVAVSLMGSGGSKRLRSGGPGPPRPFEHGAEGSARVAAARTRPPGRIREEVVLDRRSPPTGDGAIDDGVDPGGRRSRLASLLAGLAAWMLLGGPAGMLAGIGLAVGLPVFLARLESARARERRLALVQVAPVVADLLAATLTAGVPLERALPVVSRAVGGPAGALLAGVRRRMELGEAADIAWSSIGQEHGLGELARTVARSSRTGAPLAGLLSVSAEELRAKAAADALIEVRKTGVRSVLPLGLCLLPAFVLLGIVPVVGGLLPSL